MDPRQLYSVLGNSQRLDGGAMFGNAPKLLWTRWVEADDANRIPLACRALLVIEPNGRKLLFEVGIGTFFEPKLKERYGVVEKEHVLLASLADLGLSHTEIDTVILSHLHFDHAGGLLTAFDAHTEPSLLFPNAQIVLGEEAWQRARAPHARDRASFIPRLHELLVASERLRIVTKGESAEEVLGPGFTFHYSDGHTPGLLLTEVDMPGGPVVFAGDLIPGAPWVHLPITMGYDRYPELLIEEKDTLLSSLLERKGRLFYTHDAKTALSRIAQDARGRFAACEPYALVRGLAD
jgi:glyoxylase-like metal-dependent hydrolase (beta-lactamase superfamily II)